MQRERNDGTLPSKRERKKEDAKAKAVFREVHSDIYAGRQSKNKEGYLSGGLVNRVHVIQEHYRTNDANQRTGINRMHPCGWRKVFKAGGNIVGARTRSGNNSYTPAKYEQQNRERGFIRNTAGVGIV